MGMILSVGATVSNPQKVIHNIQMCRGKALTNEAFVQWLKRKR